VPEVDEICPEMLKALEIVGLSLLTHLFNVACSSGTTPVEWQTEVVCGSVEDAAEIWGHQSYFCELFGFCVTKARAVSVFLAQD